ncbi:MAG: heavy metal sensor histidine kinase [Rubrivivax sp.]|nr:heavy metal sensor histidine kinase [Rubrivivax sp.]MBK8527159.1 heavy metal sensor histidine kinase [Rubrivivax sp.]
MTLTACNTPSISKRLARTLAMLMLAALGAASAIIYSATAMRLHDAQMDTLADKTKVLTQAVGAACEAGETQLLARLALFEPARAGTLLTLSRGDGSTIYRDADNPVFRDRIGNDFIVPAQRIAGGEVRGHLEVDVTHDTRMLKGLAVTLLVATLGCAALTGMGIRWMVQRDLKPLADLAAQTRAISPRRLDQRLKLDQPAEELQPWIEQFNALMDRLERAAAQLEGFNADVAHELRTPLATLIGETEIALSRERSCESLRDTLASNLEEMQRLSALVNDMLFLSNADRGAVARRGQPVSLAELARQVAEFHEGTLDEAGLKLEVVGDAQLAVDEPLFKRALSNLLGNATRFASPGSTVQVQIGGEAAPAADGAEVQVLVRNQGQAIAPQQLPRLFDRFFRGDDSRCCDGELQHHGLGLAIVAAIARMHAGRTLARSQGGITEVGFTLAA